MFDYFYHFLAENGISKVNPKHETFLTISLSSFLSFSRTFSFFFFFFFFFFFLLFFVFVFFFGGWGGGWGGFPAFFGLLLLLP